MRLKTINLTERSKYSVYFSADVNITDGEGRTMLHHAVENEREAVVRLLTELPSQVHRKGPLRNAVGSASHKLEIDASIQDNRKRTALFLSVAGGKLSLVEVLNDVRCWCVVPPLLVL